MKQILRITIGLTISCLFAALVMGSVFTLTDKAKRHNEHQNVQDTMLELLGYGLVPEEEWRGPLRVRPRRRRPPYFPR